MYRGLLAALLCEMPRKVIKLWGFELTKQLLDEYQPKIAPYLPFLYKGDGPDIVAGIVAGTAELVVDLPFEVTKVRMQTSSVR